MMNHFPNEMSYRVWKLIEFDARNNIKSQLGLFSLLANLDPSIEKKKKKEQETKTKDQGLEF